MEKKYSLSKNQIIAQEQRVIKEICASVLSNNKDLHLLDDLFQDVNVILLTQLDETIQSLYETNQLRYFVARVVTNQVLSTSSPFHKTYRLREPLKPFLEDDYDSRADEVWAKVPKLDSELAQNLIYLRFDYALKMDEIAIVQGVSTRYVYKVLAQSLLKLKNNHEK
tara:strand:+ start:2950 stop:3450 length:501 start_codon:yes stop_codon:yes gene_type:complete